MAVRVVVRSGHGPVRENQYTVSVSAVQFHSTAIMFERAGRRRAVARLAIFTRTTAGRLTRVGQRIVPVSTARCWLNVSGQSILQVAERILSGFNFGLIVGELGVPKHRRISPPSTRVGGNPIDAFY